MSQPNAYFWGLQSLSRETKLIFGSFAPNSTSAISAAKGDGWTATRSAAGKITITFTHKWKDLIAAVATVQSTADNVDAYAQFGDYSAANGTLVIKVKTGATNTDLAANANTRVHFCVAFKRTSVTPQNTASVS